MPNPVADSRLIRVEGAYINKHFREIITFAVLTLTIAISGSNNPPLYGIVCLVFLSTVYLHHRREKSKRLKELDENKNPNEYETLLQQSIEEQIHWKSTIFIKALLIWLVIISLGWSFLDRGTPTYNFLYGNPLPPQYQNILLK